MITVIGNLKGGTGKSTVAFNLALWLKIKQGGVTLFDLDPQKTLSDVVDIREEEGYEPDLEVFDDVDALKAWKGAAANVTAGQKAFYHRAKCNGAARYGKYSREMERMPT